MQFSTLVVAAMAAFVAASPAAGSRRQDQQHHQRHSRAWPYQPQPQRPPVASSGCGKTVPVPLGVLSHVNLTMLNVTIGRDRKYGIWLPPSYDPTVPNPVILAFHGGGGNSTMQEPVSELHRPEFNRRGYIAVYPESTEEYAGRMWEVSPAIALRGVDDMGYVAALLEHIKQELCVDETRIYATGMSQGGGMANMLACHPVLSTQIAAFAAVSGSYFYKWPDMPPRASWRLLEDSGYWRDHSGDPHCHPRDDILPCKPGRKGIPIMAFHGAGDETIRYGGGLAEKHYACTPALDYWAAEWARRNGLDPEDIRRSTRTWDAVGDPGNKKLGADSKRFVYGEHTDPRGLVTLVWHGGLHYWPKTYEWNERPVTATFNATTMIMEFFGRFSLHDENPREGMIQQPAPGGQVYRPAPSSDDADSVGATWLAAIEAAFVGLLEAVHLA